MFLITGCKYLGNYQGGDSSLDVNELALLHMEEKYGEKFTYAAPSGNSMTGTREFLTFCESLPGKTVVAQIENYKTDTPIYKDNYLEVLYEKDTISYFKKVADEVFGENIVHYEVSNLSVSSNLSKDTSFKSFYEDPSTFIVAYVEVKESEYNSNKQFEEFFTQLNSSNGSIMVSVIVVKDSMYGTLELDDLKLLPYKEQDIASIYGETINGSFQYELPKER